MYMSNIFRKAILRSKGLTLAPKANIFILPPSFVNRTKSQKDINNKSKKQEESDSSEEIEKVEKKTKKGTKNQVKADMNNINFTNTQNQSSPFINPLKKSNASESEIFVTNTKSPKTLRSKEDDVHSQRFMETYKTETDDFYFNIRKDLHKYTFDNQAKTAITLNLNDVNIINIENEETFFKVPQLSHNLDIIVNKPGIYSIDEISKLQADGGAFVKKVFSPNEVDLSKIPPFVPPSRDSLLLKFAQESNIRYVMSTSTISSVLSQIYYLLSSFRNPSFDNISDDYQSEPKKFMISQRKPITTFLRKIDKENNIYALDSDPGLFYTRNVILLELGKIIERSLTLSPNKFKRIFTNEKVSLNSKDDDNLELDDDHHRFMKLNNDICLRSQIDCYAINPTTGTPFVFEIKSRTCCPMRYDLENYTDYIDYRVSQYRGLHSSYEREYYDLIRGAFLKYAFQLKIGRMDGAFIAYHNTQEIFGFEYIKTSEIEKRIFGNDVYAEVAFTVCSKILTLVLNSVLEELKGEKYEMVKLGVYACSNYRKLIVFTELFEDSVPWGKQELREQTKEIKDEFDYYSKIIKNKNKVLKFEFQIFPYINGVLQRNSIFTFTQGDQLEIKYKFYKMGQPQFIDYMNFLHEAYKFETINLDLSYAGAWVK